MGKSTYRDVETNRLKIVFLGSGNVASHLAEKLDNTTRIVQVFSPTLSHAQALSQHLHNKPLPIDQLELITPEADFYIISVADYAITDVARHLRDVKGIVVHTSGSVSLSGIKEVLGHNRCGVLYPLQTFSKDIELDISTIPFLIEGLEDTVIKKINDLALNLSDNILNVDSITREHIHIAAVMANNFANHIWTLADRHLKAKTPCDFKILEPLLKETLRKALKISPEAAQTGPAKRNDTETINKHISKLDPLTAQIYELLSKSIAQKPF